MSQSEADRWDAKYQNERESWLAQEPRHLLTANAFLLPGKGKALDAASGVGTSAIFLAQHGLQTYALDISEYALRQAKKRAEAAGLVLEAAVIDLSKPWLPDNYFDVILNFHFLERATIPFYRRTLKSGGLIFFHTFCKRPGQTEDRIYYLEPGELIGWFNDYEVIHYTEEDSLLIENSKERSYAQLIARKP